MAVSSSPAPCPRPFAKEPLTRNISYDCCSTRRITLMGRRIRIYPAVYRRKRRRKERWECVYERCEYQAARLYPRPHEGCCIKVGPIHVYPRYVFFFSTHHCLTHTHTDNHMLPPEIEQVLHQVQAHANYMPDWQMDKVLRDELGADWQANLFTQFDRTPIASASIGQVHRAILKDGRQVAVKIQFPGVASSIESDLSNLSLLLRTSALLPKGLYLQNTIAVMRRELEDECDYIREAAAGKKFAHLLAGDTFFVVPQVIDEATTGKVLTTEWMDGKPLSRVKNLSQETRDLASCTVFSLLVTFNDLGKLDWHQHSPSLSSRTLSIPIHANRSQLGKLFILPFLLPLRLPIIIIAPDPADRFWRK